MSRFANLEFDPDGAPEPSRKAPKTRETADEMRHLERAEDLFARGDWEGALRLYSRALEANRRLIRAWAGQVLCLAELDELKEARLWADKALELFKNNPSLLAAKAIVCARMGDSTFGLALSDTAVGEQGLSADVWLARAEVLLLRREKNADYCFRKAAACPGGDWRLWVRMARTATQYDAPALAHDYAVKAVETEPTLVATWLALGECQRKMGLNRKAVESFRRALEIEPQNSDARRAVHALENRSWWRKLFGR